MGDGLVQCRQTLDVSLWYLAHISGIHFFMLIIVTIEGCLYHSCRRVWQPMLLPLAKVLRALMEYIKLYHLNVTFLWFELHTWQNSHCIKTTFFGKVVSCLCLQKELWILKPVKLSLYTARIKLEFKVNLQGYS